MAQPNEPSPGPCLTFLPLRIMDKLEVGRVRRVLMQCTPFAQVIFIGAGKPPTIDHPHCKRKCKGGPWCPHIALMLLFVATSPTMASATEKMAQHVCIRSHK